MRVRASIIIALIVTLGVLYLSSYPMHFKIEFQYSPHAAPPELKLQLTPPSDEHRREREEPPIITPNSLRAD